MSRHLVPALAGLLLAGCATVELPALRSSVPAAWHSTVPSSTASPTASATTDDGAPAPDLQRWWQALGDPLIDRLAPELLRQNLGLAQARSRLRLARLQAQRDDALYRPVLTANARPTQDSAAIDTYYRSSIDATWELPLRGERGAIAQIAQAQVERALADGASAQVAALAELVRQVLALRQAQSDEAAAGRLVDLDRQLLDSQRRLRGLQLGSPEDERAAAARLAESELQRLPPRQAAQAALHAIAALLGRTEPDPAWGDAASAAVDDREWPGARVPVLPAALLRTRADIRAAEAEVRLAAGELGMARAELYPRITLAAAGVWSYNLTQNRRTVAGHVSAIGPLIDIPLFDWRRRQAQAEGRAEAVQTAVLAWQQTVVDAISEAERALSLLALAVEQARLQRATAARAREAREQHAARARLGLAAAPGGLLLERQLVQAEQAARTARLAQGQAFVSLYKALGGAPAFDAETLAESRP